MEEERDAELQESGRTVPGTGVDQGRTVDRLQRQIPGDDATPRESAVRAAILISIFVFSRSSI